MAHASHPFRRADWSNLAITSHGKTKLSNFAKDNWFHPAQLRFREGILAGGVVIGPSCLSEEALMNKSMIPTVLLIAGGLMAPSIAIAEESGLNIPDNDSVFVDGKSFQVIPGKAKGDAAAQIKSLSARDLGPAAIIFRSGGRLYIADGQSEMANALSRMANGSGPTANVQNPMANGPGPMQMANPQSPMASAPSQAAGAQAMAAVPGRNYAYDPRAYNPALLGGGSVGYNYDVAHDYAYDPRAYNPRLLGGGSTGYNNQVATDYAYDPKGYYRPSLVGGGSTGYNNQVATDYAYDPQQGYPIRNPNPWANDYAYDPRLTAQPALIYDPDYVDYRLKKAFADNWTADSDQ
jgi:hypothetical protein